MESSTNCLKLHVMIFAHSLLLELLKCENANDFSFLRTNIWPKSVVFLFPSPNYPYGFSQRDAGSSFIEIKACFYITILLDIRKELTDSSFFGPQVSTVSLHKVKSDHTCYLLNIGWLFQLENGPGLLHCFHYYFCNSCRSTPAASATHSLR